MAGIARASDNAPAVHDLPIGTGQTGGRKESDSMGLKKIDVPTLIIHGDHDQIVPIADPSMLSANLVKGARLKVIPSAPHGLCSTLKDQINQELLTFIKG